MPQLQITRQQDEVIVFKVETKHTGFMGINHNRNKLIMFMLEEET